MSGLLRAAGRMVAAGTVILAAAGCAGGQIGADSTPQSQTFAGVGYQAKLFTGSNLVAAPDVRGTTVTGKPLSLSSYRGDIVVLNFWGSWCDACRQEAPTLGTVARRLYPDGVRFIGVDIRDEPDSAQAFMQTFRLSYPSLNDPNDEIALDFRHTVPPDALPDTIIINRAGRIAATIIGGATYDNLLTLVSKIGKTR